MFFELTKNKIQAFECCKCEIDVLLELQKPFKKLKPRDFTILGHKAKKCLKHANFTKCSNHKVSDFLGCEK